MRTLDGETLYAPEADRSGRTTPTTSRSRAAATLLQCLRARFCAALLGVLAVTLAGAAPTLAAFPDRVVRIVVPFAAGGGTDLIARRLADEMGKVLGQRVIVENRPGADLMGGQIQVMFTTAASVASHIQSGRLRPLAVTTADRASLYPDLPTVAEAGVTGYVAESWYGLYAPAGTPAEIVAVLNQAARRAAESEAFAKLKDIEGLTIEAGAPADLDRYVRAEAERWKRLVEAANIRTERQ
ncbi:Bug family tripartite tricarboxylate transporter substrate binding protein [Rhodoplanes sp. SY1]|uniref:Bug family tripartite tricarboxylate transporter substrate binding protein n=1 Tax=Rhodoplanes sp. SY1 TaxID=3166646 RepID=UPI0038B533E1